MSEQDEKKPTTSAKADEEGNEDGRTTSNPLHRFLQSTEERVSVRPQTVSLRDHRSPSAVSTSAKPSTGVNSQAVDTSTSKPSAWLSLISKS